MPVVNIPSITMKEWGFLRHEILMRDKYTCQYCGLMSDNLCVDHIIPLSEGGSNNTANLSAACKPCNSSKSNRTVEQWKLGEKSRRGGRQEVDRFIIQPRVRINSKAIKKVLSDIKKHKIPIWKFCKRSGYTKHAVLKIIKNKKSIICSKARKERIKKLYIDMIYCKTNNKITLKDCGY